MFIIIIEEVIIKNILILSLFFLFNSFSFGQNEVKSSFGLQVGTGFSFINFSNSDIGLNLFTSLNYEIQNNNYSFSYLHSSEFVLFKHPEEFVSSFELKYGRSIDFSIRGLIFPFPFLIILKKDFNYSLIGRIGISYNRNRVRTDLINNEYFSSSYNSEIKTGFGLPIEIEIREEITSFLGMGVSVFTNFNKLNNYSGFNFSIYIGKF